MSHVLFSRYRLGKHLKQYAPWYQPVLKTARLAISIITLLKEQTRVARLSFADVIKRVSEYEKDHPAYISSKVDEVERYVVVHGQIILQTEFPQICRPQALSHSVASSLKIPTHSLRFSSSNCPSI